ncbi:MAG: Bug family tripartite tricarboxylate transporter substrate binding protein [Lautropia sp.]
MESIEQCGTEPDTRRHDRHRRRAGLKLATLAAGAAIGWPAVSRAQTFPDRPLRVVVPFATGGGADVLGRLMARKLSEILGQPVVVENHPGAGGSLGSEMVARGAADGYSLLIVNANAHVANSALYSSLRYSPINDFTALGSFGIIRYVLVVGAKFPAQNFADFTKMVHAAPGKYNYASGGVGSGPHLAMEMLKQAAKLDLPHVPYKGSGPALVDVAGGHVATAFDNVAAIPLIRSGQLRALAITGKRSTALPDVPTFAEVGMPDFDVSGVFGFLAAKGLPGPVAAKLKETLLQAARDPGVQQQLVAQGIDPAPGTGEQYETVLKNESVRWERVIKAAGIKL